MKDISKTEAKNKIEDFFQHTSFSSHEVRAVKRLAMRHRIKLEKYRRLFCKKCLSQLTGKIKVTKTHKTVECSVCGFNNKVRIN